MILEVFGRGWDFVVCFIGSGIMVDLFFYFLSLDYVIRFGSYIERGNWVRGFENEVRVFRC